MISRVAETCFWFGRYLERAESSTRLLGATQDLVFDADLSSVQCWQPLVIVSGQYPVFCEKLGAPAAGNGELVQSYMTWNPENPVSVWNSVRAARETARTIRDVLSLDVWEEVNQLYLWLASGQGKNRYESGRDEFYRGVRRRMQLTLGLVRSTMLHDDPMRFLWLGVMLERVGQGARILDMHHHSLSGERPHELVELGLWLALLRASSGFEAYMKRNSGRLGRNRVASFLLFEEQFPRSLRYCLRSSLAVMRQIWTDADAAGTGFRSIGALAETCAWFDRLEPTLRTLSIHDLLTEIVDRTALLCQTLQTEMVGPVRRGVVAGDPVAPPSATEA